MCVQVVWIMELAEESRRLSVKTYSYIYSLAQIHGYSPMLQHIHADTAMTNIHRQPVKTPAPALSFRAGTCGQGPCLTPARFTLELPASGLLSDVPPVFSVTGGGTSWMRLVCRTSKAAICCPIPSVPSHFSPSPHLIPHDLPVLPPEHCRIAPLALAANKGLMVGYVQGASFVVAASQRDK